MESQVIPNKNIYHILEEAQPFTLLDKSTLDYLVPKITYDTFPADSFIFTQGERSKKVLFIIISGMAEIRVKSEKGRETVAGYRKQGEFFGETVVLSDKTYPASVRALTNLECMLVKAEDFENLLTSNASFASFFTQELAERFRSLFHEISFELGPAFFYEGHAALKRASELMSKPVITCSPEEPSDRIAKVMEVNHISAVVLTDDDGIVSGLVTEKELVQRVVAKNQTPNSIIASEISVSHPVCISAEVYYYQVLLELIKAKEKHAIVTEKKKPVGIITIRDLIRARNTGVISILDRLESTLDLQDLALVGKEIDQVLIGLAAEKAPIPEILDIITEFYDRLTRQIIDISIEKLQPEYGPPPVKFCWLNLGSSGRREQFLRTDQDNALIYEDTTDVNLADKAKQYFEKLAGLIVSGLTECGFKPCPGGVMASNSLWRGNQSSWHAKVSDWVHGAETDHIRLLSIYLDFRPVYGYFPLAEQLRDLTNKLFSKQSLTIGFLAEDAAQGRVPLGLLGQPVGERSGEHRSEINLKTSASVHLIDCARLLSLKKKATVTNTLERLSYLKETNTLSKDLVDLVETAHKTIMLFRLRSNVEKMKKELPLDNYLDLKTLTPREKSLLKDALKAIDKLMTITREANLVY